MGWSNELMDSKIYDDSNLVDTFESTNIYKVNYFGYCKSTIDKNIYCSANGDAGMDVMGILVRDIGIQLGQLSTIHENATKTMGESMLFMYHLTLTSMKEFLRNDRKRENGLLKILIGDLEENVNEDGSKTSKHSKYNKGVNIAYGLMLFNDYFFWVFVGEIIISFLCLGIVGSLGISLLWGKNHQIIPFFLKLSSSILIVTSSCTFLANLIYFLVLKTLEPSQNTTESYTDWELLQVSIGSGFIIGCVRYLVQWMFLPITFLAAKHYSLKKQDIFKADRLLDEENKI